MHPTNLAGYSDTFAFGVGGNQQVGVSGGSATGGQDHAFLWTGTAASAIDLHPTNLTEFVASIAYGTNGVHQVGYAAGNNGSHAILWSGTADSAVDLNSLLPFASSDSTAYSIDAQGNIFGIANGAGGLHAVEWSPVPEPAAVGPIRRRRTGVARLSSLDCRRHPGQHTPYHSKSMTPVPFNSAPTIETLLFSIDKLHAMNLCESPQGFLQHEFRRQKRFEHTASDHSTIRGFAAFDELYRTSELPARLYEERNSNLIDDRWMARCVERVIYRPLPTPGATGSASALGYV